MKMKLSKLKEQHYCDMEADLGFAQFMRLYRHRRWYTVDVQWKSASRRGCDWLMTLDKLILR